MSIPQLLYLSRHTTYTSSSTCPSRTETNALHVTYLRSVGPILPGSCFNLSPQRLSTVDVRRVNDSRPSEEVTLREDFLQPTCNFGDSQDASMLISQYEVCTSLMYRAQNRGSSVSDSKSLQMGFIRQPNAWIMDVLRLID